MNLNFLNNLKENIEKNEALSNVIDEVGDFINEVAEKLGKNNDLDIVSEITSERKSTMASENSIMKARDEILQEYANETREKGDLYFVFNKVKDSDDYRIIKFEQDKDSTIKISKDDLPNDVKLNSVLRIKDDKLVLDEKDTKQVIDSIKEKANEILDKQDGILNEYRKEGHIYQVTEDINNKIFLWDTTAKPDFEIEEINFPTELLDKAKEGNKFIYENGTYKEYKIDDF